MKLHYFDVPGKAEMIRLLLWYTKTQFYDRRIKY